MTNTMPILSTATGYFFTAAFMPVMAAANVAVNPTQIDSYTLYGGTIAGFLAFLYHRSKHPHMGWEGLGIAFLASVAAGYIFPEVFVDWKWPDAQLSKKAWLGLSLVFGLGGAPIVTYIIKWWNKNTPEAADRVLSVSVPPASDGKHTQVEIRQRIEKSKPLGQGPKP